jgi:histidinol-phosphate/aromatic aminotransferase/cobyric acid decarboxylase-like protein
MAHHGGLTTFSRRSFLQVSTAASAALALRIVTEPMLAYAQELPYAPVGGVRINANENPLGPCAAARSAVAAIMPEAGRYRFRLTEEFVNLYAQSVGVKRTMSGFLPVQASRCTTPSWLSPRPGRVT